MGRGGGGEGEEEEEEGDASVELAAHDELIEFNDEPSLERFL